MKFKTQNRKEISPYIVNRLRKIGRAPLILGKRFKIVPTGKKYLGTQYYIPSYDINNIENLFGYGQSGSGKTWGLYNLIGQSFFFENRTWVIIDNKGSYRQNDKPNTRYKRVLESFGLQPRGIPKNDIIVCAPEYYINSMNPSEIKMDQINYHYRIPIRMANIPILFYMTKLNPETMYSSAYDTNWKRMMARTRKNPKKEDLYRMLNEIMTSQNTTVVRWYQNLVNKIRDIEDLILTEEPFSPIGYGLLKAIKDHRPKWIVITFKRTDSSSDSVNLAIYSAVLQEIKIITEYAKDYNLDLRVGLFVDEMQHYISNKNTIAFQQTIECIYRWGRANRLFRIWATQTNRHLDKLLQDDIQNFNRDGTYQKMLRFQLIDRAGYCTYMDRQIGNSFDLDLPYYVPYIETSPPMFTIGE